MKIPHVNLDEFELDLEVAKIIPLELAFFYDILAIDKVGNCLTVAVPYQEYFDTADMQILKINLSEKLKLNVQLVSADVEILELLIQSTYTQEKSQVC